MIPEPPLSEQILRLAHWMTAICNGTCEFTREGEAVFAASLHAAAEAAERLEADLKASRDALLDDAARKLLSEQVVASAAQPALTTAQFDMLVQVACGQVPGVVLFPKPHRAALRVVECPFGGDAA
ncbi:hypothetical protein CCR97_04265 [Rhodoplanes elegans]|uniref:Uncharacterized protein n=1 Tax=Rhodoplanes elegans TaxID=29408 RepID=A0A327KQ27_9BRAD|nr:hypothetical protein [Rhodoplanes elegans]MBK5957424.1 hypothetical protein [Rhodoplanes elegans]RAI37478.1 hypothetical protein CH338_15995 [Rhodoplanes elegans]